MGWPQGRDRLRVVLVGGGSGGRARTARYIRACELHGTFCGFRIRTEEGRHVSYWPEGPTNRGKIQEFGIFFGGLGTHRCTTVRQRCLVSTTTVPLEGLLLVALAGNAVLPERTASGDLDSSTDTSADTSEECPMPVARY